MTIYRKRSDTAQIIFDDLVAHGASDGWAIRRRTGLTEMQFQYGKGFLQDELQTKHGRPLIWSPQRGVYDLTMSQPDWRNYLANWRLRSIYTQLDRTLQTAEAGGMLFGYKKKVRAAISAIKAARDLVDSAI